MKVFRVKKIENTYEVLRIKNPISDSCVDICSERGGIVLRYRSHGCELLHLDEDEFLDKSKKIHGGIPILFPICAQLIDKKYRWFESEYQMTDHGFARDLPWQVVDIGEFETYGFVTLELNSNDYTRRMYPFEFRVRFMYKLFEDRLEIIQVYENPGSEELPFYAGFHPYFKTVNKLLKFETDATRYLDYNDYREYDFNGLIDMTDKRESIALYDAKTPKTSFALDELNKKITMEYGKEFTNVQIWTNGDYICVEPWMALTYALNDKRGLKFLSPGKKLSTFLSIRVTENE